MPKHRTAFRNRLEAFLARALGASLARKTPEAAEAAGRALGRLFRRLDGRRRSLARKNLSLAFPELTAAEVEALSVRCFEHFGGVTAELVHAAAHEPGDALQRVETEGAAIAKDAFATGRGVFFLTAHLGNWEWAALGTGALGIPTGVVARPLDNPLLDATFTRLRTSTGNTVIGKRDAVRVMLRAIRSGGAIGILIDQHAHPPDAVTAPFFGRPAATSSALAKLADRTEALIVPAHAVRVAPARWRLTYEPPLDVRTLSREERGVERLTARLNGILEQMIRRNPEQWLWLHNRWRLD
ncbi:MAG: lysophospholipid acyltransferase family protein [Thermoanaerobaculia bacterium]|nr:lysophospholipid acyltransferase family protein [Thermoanaerobaculia bacterium]